MEEHIKELEKVITQIDDEFGGDIGFIPPISLDVVNNLSIRMGVEIPAILIHFYTKISNGLIIGNKRILSIEDHLQKKTLIDNIERVNNPVLSFWFKNRSQIFNDYLIIGTYGQTCFCFSKKYTFENPKLYICENANSQKGVDFNLLNIDFAGLIKQMVINEFEDL